MSNRFTKHSTGGGGGDIGGSINLNQVAFGISPNTINGIPDFYYDGTTFQVLSGGNRKLFISPGAEQYFMGDIDAENNGTQFGIQDSSKQAFITGKINPTTFIKGLKINNRDLNYLLGDTESNNNNTNISIQDDVSIIDFNGFQGPFVQSAVTFTGTVDGFDTPTGFVGTQPSSYQVQQVGTGNGQVLENVTWVGGIPVIGDPVNGDTTGATGTVGQIDPINPGTVYLSSVTGDFTGETSVTSSFGGTIAGPISGLVDTYVITINGVLETTLAIPMYTTAVPDANGVILTWSITSGHGGNDEWDFTFTFPTGRIGTFDGQSHVVQLGDIDTIQNGTQLIVNDNHFSVSNTNRYVGGMSKNIITAASSIDLGTDGNKFHIQGAATINLIGIDNWTSGSEVVLIFNNSLTINHNSASTATHKGILCPGGANLVVPANTIIRLMIDHNLSDKWIISSVVTFS